MSDRILTHSELIRLLHFDGISGRFTWRVRRSWRAPVGSTAGTIRENRPNGNKYICICIHGKNYQAHRLAWFYTHQEWPDEIDHVNHDGTDNRLENLRSTNRAGNSRNLRKPKNNSSGCVGVAFHQGKWVAAIEVLGRKYHLGRFADKSEAIAKRKAAEQYYGFHPNHGS